MTNSNDFGKIIKQRRVMMDLTGAELAAKSGVSAAHLGRIERGQRFPSARTLHKIAKPLGFSEEELFASAGYLSPPSTVVESEAQPGRVDPYVAAVLLREPVEVQRTVIAILSILKSMGKASDRDIGFAEYVHRKYPEVDEDIITMMEDILEHPLGQSVQKHGLKPA